MAIWQYADNVADEALIRLAMTLSACPFCTVALELLRDDDNSHGRSGEYESTIHQFWVCPTCGWWKSYTSFRHTDDCVRIFSEDGAAATLRTLHPSDLTQPIEEVRAYLAAKYNERFDIHPRTFELVVESVFRDYGYGAEATAYSNDGASTLF